MMNSDSKERLEEIFNSLLEVLEENQVSPEDGALLSANLLFSSLNFLGEEEAEEINESINESIEDILGMISDSSHMMPTVFKPRNKPFYLIGLNRSWGLDPSLLDEEN